MIAIDPCHLSGLDFSISSIVAIRQTWRDGDAFRYLDAGRPDHGLCLVTEGEILYTDVDGCQQTAGVGKVVFLPKGKRYSAEFYGSVKCILINFLLADAMGRGLTLSDDIFCVDGEAAASLFTQIADCYRGAGSLMHLKALAFSLLEILFSPKTSEGDDVIEQCVSYIQSHYAEIENVTALAALFGYGETTFRKHFREQMGMSPIHYINAVKIERACRMLQSSEMTVGAICEFLGFYDVSYFHKVFKRYTGMTPGEYARTFPEN